MPIRLVQQCPFCGSYDIKVITNRNSTSFVAVNCDASKTGCGARSGYFEDCDEAVESWNYRHLPEGYRLVPIRNLKTAVKLMRATGAASGWHREADALDAIIATPEPK